jgi:hypothetical protein
LVGLVTADEVSLKKIPLLSVLHSIAKRDDRHGLFPPLVAYTVALSHAVRKKGASSP